MSLRIVVFFGLSVLIGIPVSAQQATKPPASTQPAAAGSDALSAALERELARAQKGLAKADPAPYYINYAVTDDEVLVIAATQGGVMTAVNARRRRTTAGTNCRTTRVRRCSRGQSNFGQGSRTARVEGLYGSL